MTSYSNSQKLSSLAKSYLTNRDIAILLDIGINQAAEIRKQFLGKHKYLFMGRIPTELFIKEYNINEKRIIKFARLEH